MAKTGYALALALLALVAISHSCIVQGMGTLTYLNKPGVSANWAAITSAGTENVSYVFEDLGTENAAAYAITYRGHYGDYYVLAGENEWGSFLSIKYGGASSGTYLASELQWLSEKGVVRGLAADDIAQITQASQAFGYYSTYDSSSGAWISMQTNCDPDGLCFRCGPLPVADSEMPNLAPLEFPAAGAAGSPSSGVFESGAASGSGDEKSGSGAGAAGTGEPGIAQYLPYVMGFIVIAGVGALVVYQLAFRQHMAQQFDPATEMAMSNGTRLEIMRELSEAEKIPTDLSTKLGKSKATIVEHLDKLVDAKLVEKLETPGKKFVYYRLTGKGRTALLRRAA
jgi:DNA-binding transcriptional ArsR family regulator